MFKHIRALGLPSLLVGAVLLAAGCGSTGQSGATTTGAAAASTTSATSAAAGPSGDPIKLGAVISTTGPNAPLGEPERNAMQYLEKTINASGGVLGRPLQVVILDDQTSPNEAVTAANRLLNQEKVVAVIGSSGSATTLAIKPITAKAGIPLMALAAASAITDQPPADFVWRIAPKETLAVERALKYIRDSLKLTKVGVLYDATAFGQSGLAQIEKMKSTYGLEVVASESYKTDETDLTAQLTKIKGANPEVMVVWGTNPGPAIAAKNMKQLGMMQPYVGSHGIANTKFIELAGDAAEGVVFPATKILFPESITNPDQKALIDAFITGYQAQFNQAPNHFSSHGYDGVALLVQAIKTAGGTDPAGIKKALDSLTSYAAADGIYTYTATNHDGLSVDDLIMVKIQGGKWTLAQ
jgi:branched-chain amino acid transport system substrate-binding protein